MLVALALSLLALTGLPALAAIPNPTDDPEFGAQWALQVMRAPGTWSATTGAGVVVAVVDTGVAFGIADLPDSKSAGSYNCTAAGPCIPVAAGDPLGHGTYVASIIASVANNGVGIAGVAPDAHILSVQTMGADGTGSVSNIAKGIQFAADQGARVINLSAGPEAFGGPAPPVFDCPIPPCLTQGGSDIHTALQPAIDYAAAHGSLVVLAAGNAQGGAAPAQSQYMGLNNVLIVGASGPHDEAASYSDTGSGPTFIWAPGGNGSCAANGRGNCIIMESPSGQNVVDEGTSFAAPQVAGVVALLIAKGYTASGAASRIQATAAGTSAGPRVDAGSAVGVTSNGPAPAANPPSASPRAPATGSTAKPPASSTAAGQASGAGSASPPASPPVPSTPTTTAAPPAPTPSPHIVTAADAPARPKATVRLVRKPPPGSQNSPKLVALIVFLAAAGAVGAVGLGQRLRI